MVEYLNRDSKPTTLDALCRAEPAWAANRIRAALAEIERLRGLLRGVADQYDRAGLTSLATTIRAALAPAEAGENKHTEGDASSDNQPSRP